MKKLLHRRWPVAVLIGIVILGLLSVNPRVLRLAGDWLDVSAPPQKADAVLLLNGGINSRPFVAAALVHGGWAPKVILNTVALHPSQAAGAVPPFHVIMLRVLAYGGVPREKVVLLDSAAQTTFDESKAVANYLAIHPVKRLLVVTEGPHTRRSKWILQRMLAGRPIEIIMIAAPPDGFDAATWWRSEPGFLFVVSEYFKLFYYALHYGWLGYQLAAMTLAIIFLCAWFRRRRQPDIHGAA